jgi:DnaJ-class molecular chaperone
MTPNYPNSSTTATIQYTYQPCKFCRGTGLQQTITTTSVLLELPKTLCGCCNGTGKVKIPYFGKVW